MVDRVNTTAAAVLARHARLRSATVTSTTLSRNRVSTASTPSSITSRKSNRPAGQGRGEGHLRRSLVGLLRQMAGPAGPPANHRQPGQTRAGEIGLGHRAGDRHRAEAARRARSLESLGIEKSAQETPNPKQIELAAPDHVSGFLKPGSKIRDFKKKAVERFVAALPMLSAKLEKSLSSPAAYAGQLDEPAETRASLAPAGGKADAGAKTARRRIL